MTSSELELNASSLSHKNGTPRQLSTSSQKASPKDKTFTRQRHPGLRTSRSTSVRRFSDLQKPYIKSTGSLNYLSSGSRPDITFTVSKLCEGNAKPTDRHGNTQKGLGFFQPTARRAPDLRGFFPALMYLCSAAVAGKTYYLVLVERSRQIHSYTCNNTTINHKISKISHFCNNLKHLIKCISTCYYAPRWLTV